MFFRKRRQIKRLEQERDYLLLWVGGRNSPLGGASADNLTCIAFGTEGDGYEPRDTGDLGRCERAYRAMPPHIQERARPTLTLWRANIARLTAIRGW